jgi:hypothetical protein
MSKDKAFPAPLRQPGEPEPDRFPAGLRANADQSDRRTDGGFLVSGAAAGVSDRTTQTTSLTWAL